MFKNTAGQKFRVFAFNSTTNQPVSGDAANITAYISKDYGAVTVLGDTSATEEQATNAKGFYLFDATQAETNADSINLTAKSTTPNVVVIGDPAHIYTLPATFGITPGTANGLPILGHNTAGIEIVPASGQGILIDVSADSTAAAILLSAGALGDGIGIIANRGIYIDGESVATTGPAVYVKGIDGADAVGIYGTLAIEPTTGNALEMVGGVGGNGLVATRGDNTAADVLLTNSDAPTLTAPIADRLIGRNIAGGSDTGRTVGQAFAAQRNKVAFDVPGAGQFTVFGTDDVTPLWTGTYTTAAGNPVTVLDPA